MLAIRLQRTGRKGHAQFRVIVQEARLSPASGRVVAQLGHYNPHSKEVVLAKDKAEFYLKNGAQPSATAANILKKEGVKLPDWVQEAGKKERAIRNPEKLRKNRPAEAEVAAEPKAEEAAPTSEDTQPEEPVNPTEDTPEDVPEPEAPAAEAEPTPEESK